MHTPKFWGYNYVLTQNKFLIYCHILRVQPAINFQKLRRNNFITLYSGPNFEISQFFISKLIYLL